MAPKPDDRPLIRCAIYTRQSVARAGSEPALVHQVQQAVANRKTKEYFPRQKPPPLLDPFVLRGLVECELCGRTMTTSMSRAFDARAVKSTPRYYRCRTPGCNGGQVAAELIEKQAFEALCRPVQAAGQRWLQYCPWPCGVRSSGRVVLRIAAAEPCLREPAVVSPLRPRRRQQQEPQELEVAAPPARMAPAASRRAQRGRWRLPEP